MQPAVDIDAITRERGESYGDFTTQGAIAQSLKDFARTCPGWGAMEPYQREAMDMILHKISRALNGNPRHLDTWVDIGGYSQIVAVRLQKGIDPV